MILNHPDVIGFLFVHEGKLIKAYLPKKVVSFQATTSEDRKSVVAVSGTCSEYTPFSVSEEILLRDVYHITNCDKFIKTFPISNITNFDKEKSPIFQKITKRSSKRKKLFMVSVPHILPTVVGNSTKEGRADENRTYDEEIIEKEYES